MKRIIRRVQTLNERAAELTAAAGQLPNRVAELREAMTATAGQLHTLKSDIQVNIADLQMDHEDDIGAALVEVAGHAPVFLQAGFLLDGLDVEVSPTQRVIVQLVREKDVEKSKIQDLVHQYEKQSTMRAILSAILKARVMVDTIEIDGLEYDKLMIGIGPVPTIRLCWRDRDAANSSSAWQLMRSQPLAGGPQTSFFGPSIHPASSVPVTSEAKPVIVAPVTAVDDDHAGAGSSALAPPPPMPDAPIPIVPPPLPSGPVDPLARFKVMPQMIKPH
jgi:hypothetical protein